MNAKYCFEPRLSNAVFFTLNIGLYTHYVSKILHLVCNTCYTAITIDYLDLTTFSGMLPEAMKNEVKQ